jgi:hypothetical protein
MASSFEIGNSVRHVYNKEWFGKVTSIKANGDVAVSWMGREPLTHPERFIRLDTADFQTESGPSCNSGSAGSSGGDGRNSRRRKDASLYGSPQGIPKAPESSLEQPELEQPLEEDLEVEDIELAEEETQEVYVREE